MQSSHSSSFNPDALATMCAAFDDAWRAVANRTTDQNREKVRAAMGRAVVALAQAGRRDRKHLANYAIHQGCFFIDMAG